MSSYTNRYKDFVVNEVPVSVPFVKIPEKGTDTFVTYKVGKSRLDKISDEKYGTPYFGWLIMQANPEYGRLEWLIPDNALLRVPYPLEQSVKDYKSALKRLLSYYGE